MTREEAIKVVRNIYQTDAEKEALETLIPELRESEDERIIKTLQEYVKNRNWNLGGPTQDEVLAWLERQKELTATMNGEPIPTENHSVDIPLAEWSEEDETRLTNTLIMLKEYAIHHYSKEDVEKSVDWLENRVKSLRPQPKPAWSEEDKEWLSEVYFAIDHSMYSNDERLAMKNYVDSLRKDRNTCDVDEFSLTLRNCLSTDSELTKMQADLFARTYGEDLYKVALGEMKTGLDRYDIEEYRNETKFDPKPGEKFWVRCKTNKTVNLWFDKDDERPAYAVTDPSGIITYIVHIKKDGTGNCVSYQNKEKFLETFDILESKR